MKLTCLSSNPSKPCFVLHFKGVTLMLDCGLDLAQLHCFLPLTVVQGSRFSSLSNWEFGNDNQRLQDLHEAGEIKDSARRAFIDGSLEFSTPELNLVDLSQIDAILLSNYNCMLALPYITEYAGFKGIVYATEPTLHIGRQYMEEMVKYIERNPQTKIASKWKHQDILSHLPAPLKDVVRPAAWKQCYTLHDINSCLSRVQLVGYNQKIDIFGSLKVTASSSGYCLGSCNWNILSEFEKISYVSGTSTLTTHPKPIDQAPLRNSDILILGCLTQTPLANPDAMIGEFCVNAALTVKNGGNVLVPCYPSGITYDLFECLSGHLDSCGLGQVPMYFLSPVSDSTLAYSNILAEWLSQMKQSKVYLPEPPFPHAELVSVGRLKNFSNIHDGLNTDFKTPCVMFAGHPSLRMGDVVHFIGMWGKSSSNTIIFTEPDYPYLDALAPFQPLQMRVCYCPIDTSLSFSQANKLIKDLRPVHLVVPEEYLAPPTVVPHRTDLVIEWEPPPLTYKRGEVLTLPLKRQFETIEITPELAATLEPVTVKPGSSVSIVTGALVVKDNKYVLESLPKEIISGRKRRPDGKLLFPRNYILGTLNIKTFIEALSQQGITDVKVDDTADGHILHLEGEEILIDCHPTSTHIISEGEEHARVKVKDTLLKCLQKL